MISCYLALGSNLRTPERQLRKALLQLRQVPGSYIKYISSLYFSEPLGLVVQPNYCNLVLCLQTRLPALCLLDYCQAIETLQNRVRKKKWGPRTLDIDILLYGKKVINCKRLTVPHPQMFHRDFVMRPLLEICPDFNLPANLKASYHWHESFAHHVLKVK